MPVSDRFWCKVVKLSCSCWLYLGCCTGSGNPVFNVSEGKQIKASRFSWEFFNGPIPKGVLVCHRCDIPACVNPNHLFLGSYKDNMVDCVNKGRIAFGDRHGRSKLTNSEVSSIRSEYVLMRDKKYLSIGKVLAKKYGVTSATISRIISGSTWSKVK